MYFYTSSQLNVSRVCKTTVQLVHRSHLWTFQLCAEGLVTTFFFRHRQSYGLLLYHASGEAPLYATASWKAPSFTLRLQRAGRYSVLKIDFVLIGQFRGNYAEIIGPYLSLPSRCSCSYWQLLSSCSWRSRLRPRSWCSRCWAWPHRWGERKHSLMWHSWFLVFSFSSLKFG